MFATLNDKAEGYLYVYESPYRLNIHPGERLRVVAVAIEGPEARTVIRTSDDRMFHIEGGEDDHLILEPQ
jgi:hypothetical protein